MRKVLIPVLVLTMFLTGITGSVKAQITLIPDPKFEQELINQGFDVAPVNGYVLKANISSITSIDVANRNITDLTGIQDFVSLTSLLCNNNNLTKLDVTKNTALTRLVCDRNQLIALDPAKNNLLTTLSCTNNRLTSLDVTKNPVLRIFYCDDNQLLDLDVTKNPALTSLGCGSNLITTLDVTKNTALTSLGCGSNLLTSLDVTKIPGLTSFGCANNLLTTLDVTKNSVLYFFACFNNRLSTLDVTANPNLTTLDCGGNKLSNLDLINNPALVYLRCQDNQLVSLDISKKPALTELRCNNNQLNCLNLKNGFNSSITIMNAINNTSLTCIQVDDATAAPGYSGWSKDPPAQYNNSCSPSIISFSPTAACTGDVVIISGCFLDGTTAVSFGTVPATSFTILPGTGIAAIVGSGASGNVDVVTPGGAATLPGFILKQLSAPASLSISASVNNICPSDTVTFTAVPSNTGTTPVYQWFLNRIPAGENSLTYNNNIFANGDQVYCIMNTIKTCPATRLVYSDTVTMIVKPVPEILFTPSDPSISSGSSVQLHAVINGSYTGYLWTPSTGLSDPYILNPVAKPLTTTVYRLQVTAANNCTTGKDLTVTIIKNMYIPNSFTPDGNGENDIFRIPPGTFFNLEMFVVYDRYGNEIFKTSDINKGWDGTNKGIRSPAGSYIYLVKGTDLKGKILLKGSVLLIR
ncbi:MAG: gliding motility-associated C-terminal domain-containing protein [Ferruginibacter sp.]